tara:strand:+ start:728 stop:1975 length:1248 start_codon:yes stop_codon:yes gene_type:complete
MLNYNKNTILLTKDILRSDYLRCYNPNSLFNTKHIDALASKGTLFSRYYCSSPSSGMAASCSFSGLNAYELDRKTFKEVDDFTQSKTLFNILEENGVKTHVLWSSEFEHLAYSHSKVFDSNTLIHYAPLGGSLDVTPQKHAFPTEQQISEKYDLADYFLNYLKDLDSRETSPWFVWCHCPHVFEPFDSYGSDIGHFDDFVGRVSKEINSEIILSGDHGHNICEKGRIVYGFDVYESSIHIPLITPHYFGKQMVDFPVSQSQLNDIILYKELEKRTFIYSDTQYYEQPDRKLMIMKDDYKYIYNKIDNSEELYDLNFDANENVNLLVKFWPDYDRNSSYRLDEVVFYPSWNNAKEYYNLLKSEKNRIWRTGNFLNEYSKGLKSRLAKGNIFNAFKTKKRAHFTEGKWGCERARVNI